MKSRQLTATYRHPLIAREGWPTLFAVAFAAVLSQALVDPLAGIIFWALWLLLLYLFRDPRRKVPSIPLAVLSPVDGQVISVGEEYDERNGCRMRLLRLAMSPLGVYSIRSPLEGKIMRQWFPGARRMSRSFGQRVKSDEGDNIILRINTGRLRRTPFCYVQSGERIGQGQRCGYVPFGAYLDLLVPDNSRLMVGEGDSVKSGVSVVARLVHE